MKRRPNSFPPSHTTKTKHRYIPYGFKRNFHRSATSVNKGTESSPQPKETNTHSPAYISVDNIEAEAQKQRDTTTKKLYYRCLLLLSAKQLIISCNTVQYSKPNQIYLIENTRWHVLGNGGERKKEDEDEKGN